MNIHFSSCLHDFKKSLFQCLKNTRGVAAVEFALLVPILLALFMGLASYGLAMFEKMELTSAARAGAQVALIDTSDIAAIQEAVVAATNNSDITTADVTVTESCQCSDGTPPSGGCGTSCGDGGTNRYFYTITATEDYTLLLFPTTITLTGTAIFRTQ